MAIYGSCQLIAALGNQDVTNEEVIMAHLYEQTGRRHWRYGDAIPDWRPMFIVEPLTEADLNEIIEAAAKGWT